MSAKYTIFFRVEKKDMKGEKNHVNTVIKDAKNI